VPTSSPSRHHTWAAGGEGQAGFGEGGGVGWGGVLLSVGIGGWVGGRQNTTPRQLEVRDREAVCVCWGVGMLLNVGTGGVGAAEHHTWTPGCERQGREGPGGHDGWAVLWSCVRGCIWGA
jgi:hypothetical protein